jgi:Xaa-Pro aminopeptidase
MLRTSFLIILTCFSSFSQIPDDGFLGVNFHRERRQKVIERLPKNSVAVLFSAPIRNRSSDVDHPYHQDANFYYLTGFKEPHAALILFDQPVKIGTEMIQEILFVADRNPYYELWEGEQLGPERAKSILGIQKVLSTTQFDSFTASMMEFSEVLIFNQLDDVRDHKNNSLDLFSLIQSLENNIVFDHTEGLSKNNATDINSHSLSETLSSLREVKTSEEISMLKKAISISVVGQIEVMKAMHTNMSELEIQGIHEFVFRKYGAKHQGYPSIVGAGNHGCVLHYTHNTADPVGDNLVLMDVGASYYGYTADITRTIPANGIFNEQQAAIYEIVLEAQKEAISAATVGAFFSTPGEVARNVIERGLIDLDIINEPNEVQRYFPHGTSHYIGLDVHDPGTYGILKTNSVITIEPGIYIPENSPCDPKWWGIAIRIEDDILITNEGPVNLSEAAPKTISEIEQMMREPSALEDFILPDLDL